MSNEAASRPNASRIPLVAALLAGSVLLSRVLGYAREAVLAGYLGATSEADAYRAAFQIPDILNHLLAGGAFAVAFVPVYTRVRDSHGEPGAARLLATALGTMTAVAVAASGLLWVYAEPLVALQFPRFSPEKQALTVALTRIVIPAQIFFVAGGVLRAALMASDRFATQALAPLLYNLGIIAGGVLGGASAGAEGFAWGALAGAAVGPFLLPLGDALRQKLRLGFRFAPNDRDFLGYLWRAAPLILGLSVLTVDEWYGRWFGQLAGEGAIARLGYARIVMLVPVAVVGQALATAALPAFSQMWAEGRREALDRAVLIALRASLGLSVLLAGALAALAEPIVALLFERGAFTSQDSVRVASLLALFAFGVPGMVTLQVAGRAFFAREDMWRPMILGTLVAAAAIPLYWVAGERFGAQGLAASGAVTMSANAGCLLVMLRRVHGGPPLAPLAETFVRALLLGAVAALAAHFGSRLAEADLPRFLAGGAAFAIVAFPGIWLIGDDAMRETTTRLLRRLLRRRP